VAKRKSQNIKTFSHYSLGKKQVTEKELVERAKRDPEAFGVLYDVYMRQIYAYTLKRVGRVEIAEDLVSLTFEKALRKLKSFTWQDVSFSSWLYTIASNTIIDFYRRRARRPQTDLDSIPEPKDGKESLDVSLSKRMFFEQVQQILPELEPDDQAVLSLKFFEDKSNEEISQVVGLNKAHVAVRIHRALKKLKVELGKKNISY